MRILFLAHRLPYPPNKGDKIRSFWELKTLSERHDVDLFCFYDDPQDQLQVSNLRNYCRSCYAEPVSPLGSRIRALCALLRGRPFTTAFFYSPSMAKRVAEAVKSNLYDLVFVFGSSMAQYAEPWPNLPKILDLVDVDSDKWVQYSNHSRGPLARLWRIEGHRLEICESTLVQVFDNTLVCTEAEAILLRTKAYNGKISVLQNYLDLDYYRPDIVPISEKIRSLQPYVIFTGTMDYFPNIDAVLFFCQAVLPVIRLQVPKLRFVIAGRSPSPQVLRLADDPFVEVTGAVPDIRPYLQGASVAVAPMRIARGVQNKILEALAMDVPVVASAAAAAALPREIALLLASATDPDVLAARVVSYLIDSPQWKGGRRDAVKLYMEGLGLPAQLEHYLREVAADRTLRTRENQVEVAV